MRWNAIAVVLCAVVVAGCATMPRPGYHPLTEVIAHRGASAAAPENTAAAFALAADMGADWFELDAMLSSDGYVVVIHDYDLERVAGVPLRVADTPLAVLQQHDVGSFRGAQFANERIPTLRQALVLAKQRGIGVYVELKSVAGDEALRQALLDAADGQPVWTPRLRREMARILDESGSKNVELTRKALALIRETGMENSVVIQSFQPIICAVAALEGDGIPVELLGSDDPDDPAQWDALLRWFYLLDLDGLNIHHESVTLSRLAMVHAAGKRMAVWTVNDPEVMKRLAHWGVDAIITDRPDVCLEVLKEAGRRRSP